MTCQRLTFLALVVAALTARDRAFAASGDKPEALRQVIVRDQEALSGKFREVRVDMLRAMERLDSADRTRATVLRKVLLSFWDTGVDERFDKGIAAIKSAERVGLADVIRATEQLQPLQNKWA